MNKEIDISNVVLKTERLTLRPWREDDVDDLFEYAKVDGVGEMAGWPHHRNIEGSKAIIKMFICEKKTFAIEYEGKVIGSVGVEKYNEEQLAQFDDKWGRELGYVLSKDYWGQGIIPEALETVINYLFKVEMLDFLVICYYDFNMQSAKVASKCGFIPYKKLPLKTLVNSDTYNGTMTLLFNKR